tara:strand:+ start:306 stop:557 length:252 start_codon:yes stop_codon:yes gene_type:complete
MIPWIIRAEYVKDYRIHITFNDGVSGEIDFSNEFDGEIFEPLMNKAYFASFHIEGHTLAWENGADFAPEYLRALLGENVSAVR